MSKRDKLAQQIEQEGAEAAAHGRGRNSNPYPQSNVSARKLWFAGYDVKVAQMSEQERRPKLKL